MEVRIKPFVLRISIENGSKTIKNSVWNKLKGFFLKYFLVLINKKFFLLSRLKAPTTASKGSPQQYYTSYELRVAAISCECLSYSADV